MKFVYDTGIRRSLFHNVRIAGSWDAAGKLSDEWTETPMHEVSSPDGAITFEAEVRLAASEVGKEFRWRVLHDGPLGLDREGIVTEQAGLGHDALHRTFTLSDNSAAEQRYYLTHVRRLGARKVRQGKDGEFGLRFAVWAPNAQAVEVVFGLPGIGQLTYLSLQNLDLPVIMGCVLYGAFFVVLASAAVDVLYAVLDPRVRRG